jgi:hypothetical protein
MPELTRSPAMGLNSSLSRDGIEYHVQTEDIPLRSKIRTQVYVDGGRVIWTDRYDYSEHLGKANLESRLIKVMRACHQRIIGGVRQGSIKMPKETVSEVQPKPRPSVVMARTTSEIWDSLVKEARRRNHRIRVSNRPPPAWDSIIENLRRSG